MTLGNHGRLVKENITHQSKKRWIARKTADLRILQGQGVRR